MILHVLLCLVAASAARTDARTSSDDTGFTARLTFPAPGAVSTGDGIVLEAPGLSNRYVPGEPFLPVRTLLVPVPPGAEPVLRYTVLSSEVLRLGDGLLISPGLDGSGLDTRPVPVPGSPGPAENAVLEGVIPLAGSQFAVVSVYPALGERPSSWATAIRVSLEWAPSVNPVPVPPDHPVRFLTGGGTYWPAPVGNRSASQFWGNPWARVSVDATGAYFLTGSLLEQQGCAVTGAPVASLAMFTGPGREFLTDTDDEHSLEEVAIRVEDLDGDGVFDDEDRLLFLGRSLNRWVYGDSATVERLYHRYATHNVYWLTWGGAPGSRMQTVQSTPDSSPGWGPGFDAMVWLEEDTSWRPAYETRTGWVWMSAQPGGTMTVPFVLEDPEGPGSIDVVTVVEEGGTNAATLRLNGSVVASDSWYGVGLHTISATGVTLQGTNTLEITYDQGAPDADLFLDHVEVGYQRGTDVAGGGVLFPSLTATGRHLFGLQGTQAGCRIFDATDFSRPAELTGLSQTTAGTSFSFTVGDSALLVVVNPGDWMQPDSVAPASPGRILGTVSDGDRLLVTSEELLNGVWGIDAVLREAGRLPVAVTTREVYDEFGQGVADPGAIRSAVRWGMDSWPSGLGGVLLVGDGHYDYRGITTSVPEQVPPRTLPGVFTAGVCFDDYYVMVHTGALLPEIPVARVPADNSTELGSCTAKTLGYASGSAGGTWMNRCLLIADDEWGGDNQYNETEHTNQCELIAEEVLPRHLDRTKFYLIEYPWPGTPPGPHPDKPQARADLIDELSEGQAAVIYIGHGSEDQIAHEKVLLSEDVDLLSNGPRLSLSIWATCDVGHFDSPGTDAIGEDLVNHPSGGSIVSIASTRGCYSVANYQLGRAILDSLYTVDGLTMCDALWLAKLAESSSYATNNRSYVMFGYPWFAIPDTDDGASVTVAGDTLRTGETNTVTGSGFPQTGLAWLEILESSAMTQYTCLGGAVIEYLKYGGTAFRGTVAVQSGQFATGCIVPVQAATGSWARSAASCLGSYEVSSGADDPAAVSAGSPPGGDYAGPLISMWIKGYEGVEDPLVTGEVVLEAELEDTSGICFLGGEGRQLRLFVNGDGMDVGRYFSYNQGSTTVGRLLVELTDLAAGEYTLILQALDGVGNPSSDTLMITTLDQNEIAITEALVYPNPGNGQRCFSFRLSTAASVSVSIYTVSGRRIRTLSASCEQGYNQIIWDGTDAEGDEPASGSYIYMIEASAEGSSVFGSRTDVQGILAVVRE